MTKFRKLNTAIDRLNDRLDRIEARGIDITKLAKPGSRNMVAEGLRKEAAKLEADRKAGAAKTAAGWSIGDRARTRRGEEGDVVSIDGSLLALDINGSVRKFAAALVTKL